MSLTGYRSQEIAGKPELWIDQSWRTPYQDRTGKRFAMTLSLTASPLSALLGTVRTTGIFVARTCAILVILA